MGAIFNITNMKNTCITFPPLHTPTIFNLLQQTIIENEKLMAQLSLFIDGVILLVC